MSVIYQMLFVVFVATTLPVCLVAKRTNTLQHSMDTTDAKVALHHQPPLWAKVWEKVPIAKDMPPSICPSTKSVDTFYLDPPNTQGDRRQKLLGKGAFGKVYLKEDKFPDDMGREKAKKYAVKIINTNAQHPFDINVFQPPRMKLPFNAQLHEMYDLRKPGSTTGDIQMVYSLYTGGELFEHMQNNRPPAKIDPKTKKFTRYMAKAFSKKKVARLGAQVAYGLWRLHRQDFVHLDLKPQNIMLREKPVDGHEKLAIIDYGLAAKGCGTDEKERRNCRGARGTPDYIAPNVLKTKTTGCTDWRECVFGVEADWFSFGVVLYNMAKRERSYMAFPGKPVRTDEKGWHFPGIDTALGEFLMTMLKKNEYSKLTTPEMREHMAGDDAANHPILNNDFWFDESLDMESAVGLDPKKQAKKDKNIRIQQFWLQVCTTYAERDDNGNAANCGKVDVEKEAQAPLCMDKHICKPDDDPEALPQWHGQRKPFLGTWGVVEATTSNNVNSKGEASYLEAKGKINYVDNRLIHIREANNCHGLQFLMQTSNTDHPEPYPASYRDSWTNMVCIKSNGGYTTSQLETVEGSVVEAYCFPDYLAETPDIGFIFTPFANKASYMPRNATFTLIKKDGISMLYVTEKPKNKKKPDDRVGQFKGTFKMLSPPRPTTSVHKV